MALRTKYEFEFRVTWWDPLPYIFKKCPDCKRRLLHLICGGPLHDSYEEASGCPECGRLFVIDQTDFRYRSAHGFFLPYTGYREWKPESSWVVRLINKIKLN